MALIDYAQKRSERVFVRSQAAFGAFTMPTARDAIKIRGAAGIPAVTSDFVRNEEVRDTPDTDQLLKRKKPPSEFTLTCYAKVPTTVGRQPQWAALMRNSFGTEQHVLTVLDFATLATDNTVVTVTIDGTAFTRTEGTHWTAAGSNATTATSLATALDGIAGIAASASGAEVLVTRDDGTGEIVITHTSLQADLSSNEVRYKLATDILEHPFTMIHGTHNAADYFRDCMVSSVGIIANGSDEATLVFSGMLGNGTFTGQTHLQGTIAAVSDGSTPRTSSDEVDFELVDSVLQVGPTDEDFTWFTIGTEHFKVLTWDPDTKTGTALGCQFSSSPAAHSDDAEVFPYLPGTDPDANDSILSMVLGEFALDGTPYRVVSCEVTKDEQLNGRLNEAFEAALTGYRRPIEGRLVEGTVVEYQRRTSLEPMLYGEREKEAEMTLRLGSSTGPRIIATLPHFRIGKVEKGELDAEFTRTLPFQGLASGTPGNDGITVSVFN